MCTVCVKSGILCPRCQSLVDRGEYDEVDMEVQKALLELEEKTHWPQLKDLVYHKSYKTNNLYIIVVSGSHLPPYFIAKFARKISEKLKSKVRIVEKTSSLKKMAAQLLVPANVLGVNILWLPDGSWQSIVRVPKKDSRLLPAKKENLEEILTKLSEMVVKIRFE